LPRDCTAVGEKHAKMISHADCTRPFRVNRFLRISPATGRAYAQSERKATQKSEEQDRTGGSTHPQLGGGWGSIAVTGENDRSRVRPCAHSILHPRGRNPSVRLPSFGGCEFRRERERASPRPSPGTDPRIRVNPGTKTATTPMYVVIELQQILRRSAGGPSAKPRRPTKRRIEGKGWYPGAPATASLAARRIIRPCMKVRRRPSSDFFTPHRRLELSYRRPEYFPPHRVPIDSPLARPWAGSW
jgi:hypothetical protein